MITLFCHYRSGSTAYADTLGTLIGELSPEQWDWHARQYQVYDGDSVVKMFRDNAQSMDTDHSTGYAVDWYIRNSSHSYVLYRSDCVGTVLSNLRGRFAEELPGHGDWDPQYTCEIDVSSEFCEEIIHGATHLLCEELVWLNTIAGRSDVTLVEMSSVFSDSWKPYVQPVTYVNGTESSVIKRIISHSLTYRRPYNQLKTEWKL
jgi:hypothetical protein